MRAPHGGLEGEGNQPQDRDLPAGQSRVQGYSSRRPGIPGWPGRVADDLLQFDWCNKINGQSGVLLCWQPCACYTATGVAQAESSDRSPDTPCGPDPGCSIVRLADQHAIELFHHRFGIQPQNPSFGRLSDVTDHALDCGRQACPV